MISCHLININKFLQSFARLFTFIQYKLVDLRHLLVGRFLKVCLLVSCFVLELIYLILEFIYQLIYLFVFIWRMSGFLLTLVDFFLVILQSQIEVCVLIINYSFILLNRKFTQAQPRVYFVKLFILGLKFPEVVLGILKTCVKNFNFLVHAVGLELFVNFFSSLLRFPFKFGIIFYL